MEYFSEVAIKSFQRSYKQMSFKWSITSQINNIIYVTSTGVMTPTLDAVLFNELGFSKHIKRTPLWGLGCAGGAAGISRAMDYCNAYPKNTTLVVAVELCRLNFPEGWIFKK